MTLEELADEVCATARATDTTSVARAKKYLARRYEMIWNEALWKDSIWGYDINYDVAATLYNELPFGNVFSIKRGAWLFPEAVGQVLAVRRTDEPLSVANQFDFYRQALDQYAQTGDPIQWANLPKICCYSDIAGTDEDDSTDIKCTIAADEGGAWSVRYMHRNGDIREASGTLSLAAGTVGAIEAILSFKKPVGQQLVYLQNTDSEAAYAAIAAADETLPQRCRILLLPRPTATTAFKTLVKLKCPPLVEDTSEAQISGIDNCLVSFALGDMLRRARQYGKAELVYREANALLTQLKSLGTWQEACVQRFTPAVYEVSGSVGDWGGGKNYW